MNLVVEAIQFCGLRTCSSWRYLQGTVHIRNQHKIWRGSRVTAEIEERVGSMFTSLK